MKKTDNKTKKVIDPCPKCGTSLISKMSGGVKCPNCDYWFCY